MSTYKWNDSPWRANTTNVNRGVLASFEHEGYTVKVRHEGAGYKAQIYKDITRFCESRPICHRQEGLETAKSGAEGIYENYRKENE